MARYIFTGGDGSTGETGLVVRNGLNNNFTELYAVKHARAHALDSASDHSAAAPPYRNKFIRSNAYNGYPTWSSLEDEDIPNSLARLSALTAHTSNTSNPHQVTLSQIASADVGIQFSDDIPARIKVKLLAESGLRFDGSTGGLKISHDSTSDVITGLLDDDSIMVYQPSVGKLVTIAGADLLTWVRTGGPNPFIVDKIVTTAGKEVTVIATSSGVTAAWSVGNTLTVTVPANIEVSSILVKLNGYPTMTLILAYADNRHTTSKLYPIMQAWREDTKAQLVGAVVTGSATPNNFVISGLINSTDNYIRIQP